MLRQRIELPPSTPAFGGLLVAARPLADIDAEWWRGVTFSGGGCAEPTMRGPCDAELSTGDTANAAVSPGDVQTFAPTTVRQGVSCTTLSGTNAGDLATARIEATREWAAGHILETGDHTTHVVDDTEVDNPALADATDLEVGPASPIDALACLEQAAADNLFGSPAFIHASPLVGTHLLAANAIWRDGRRWRTASGNVLVVSPGYSGSEMYVTAEVFSASGQQQVTDPARSIDRSVNLMESWADELVLSVFDPCWSGRISVDVTACGAT